jgi:hypothetical protein
VQAEICWIICHNNSVRGETALKEFAQSVLHHRRELLTDQSHVPVLQRYADLVT